MDNTVQKFKDERSGGRRLNDLLILLMFLLTAAMAVVSYAVNMKALGWESASSTGLALPVADILKTKNPSVLLYVSPETAKYLGSVGGNYDVLLKPWRNFFAQERISYNEINHLGKMPDPRKTVLILPSVLAIGDAERTAIRAFQERGGNILATSTVGARNGSGEWTGYDFAKTLFGVTVAGDILPDKDERYLNIFGDLPFSQSYKPGERIWLGKLGANPLRLQGGRIAGSLTDWARTSSGNNEENAAVLYDELDDKHNARWVMLSFAETSWEIQRNAVHGLLTDALGWLEHRPLVYKASWPFPYHAAQIIEMDTEEGFPNAHRFAAMMEKIDAPATFYLLTSVATRFPDVVKELARRHEIAYHGDVHDGFKGQTEAVQSRRMATMQSDMKSILGNLDGITGFRAPLESYDKVTEDLLVKNKLRHHAASPNSSDARIPMFYPDDKQGRGQATVVLPRTQFDDINLLRSGRNNKNLIKEHLVNDLNQVVQMGGLGLLSIHTQNFAEDSPLATAMPDFLDHLNKERQVVWVAESKKVADWWHDREKLAYKVTNVAAKTNLDVTIEGATPIRGASLIVCSPYAKANLHLQPSKSNMAVPRTKAIDDFRTAVIFSDMQPGSYSYSLTFAKD